MLYKVKLIQANVRNKNDYLYTSEALKSLNLIINSNKFPIYNINSDERIGYSINSYIRDDLLYIFVNLKEEAKFIDAYVNFLYTWTKEVHPPIELRFFIKSKSSAFFDESNVKRIEKLFI